jgi:hypothetical protein
VIELVTPLNDLWQEFCRRLETLLGTPDDNRCHGTSSDKSYHFSSMLLSEMGVDVIKNLIVLRNHGGNCDCTILFNIDESFEMAKKFGLDPLSETYLEDLNAFLDKKITERIGKTKSDKDGLQKAIERADELLKKYKR